MNVIHPLINDDVHSICNDIMHAIYGENSHVIQRVQHRLIIREKRGGLTELVRGLLVEPSLTHQERSIRQQK